MARKTGTNYIIVLIGLFIVIGGVLALGLLDMAPEGKEVRQSLPVETLYGS